MKAFSVKIKFPMDHNTELAISTDNYSALWTEVWKPPVLSYLVFHFAHFMTTPFCYKLSTFTLISAMLTTKRALLHNELLSQKKHRQVCTLFVKKKKSYDNRKLLYSSTFFCHFNVSGSGCCEHKPCKFRVTEEWTKENQDMSLH